MPSNSPETNSPDTEHDALHHVQHVSQMLETVISHVHGDLGKLDDPKVISLFQSAGDVLLKLKASFDEFEEGWSSPATGRFVIQRASESRNEFWTGSGWSENESDARRYAIEPDVAAVTGDESAVAAVIWNSEFGVRHA